VADDEPEHFIVHSVINGQKVNLLVDTGATTEYIDDKFARRIGVKVENCRPRSVRLGNNTISIIDKKVETKLRCGEDFSTKVTFYVMKALPAGIDALVGMRYLNDHNIWLNPKTKHMLILGQDQSQLHVV
jgi:clan AA aspartic protease (TIGR02281 family)